MMRDASPRLVVRESHVGIKGGLRDTERAADVADGVLPLPIEINGEGILRGVEARRASELAA
jgi:hypothetical protein